MEVNLYAVYVSIDEHLNLVGAYVLLKASAILHKFVNVLRSVKGRLVVHGTS
jgi:hypothetical protein